MRSRQCRSAVRTSQYNKAKFSDQKQTTHGSPVNESGFDIGNSDAYNIEQRTSQSRGRNSTASLDRIGKTTHENGQGEPKTNSNEIKNNKDESYDDQSEKKQKNPVEVTVENTEKIFHDNFESSHVRRKETGKMSASISTPNPKKYSTKTTASFTSSKNNLELLTIPHKSRSRELTVPDLQPLTVPLLPQPTRTLTHRPRALSPSPVTATRGRHIRASSAQQAPVVLQLFKPNKQPVSISKIDMDRQDLHEWPSDDKISSIGNASTTSGNNNGATHQKGGGATVLSLQNNHITKISPNTALSGVVLLDLYHNKLSSLHGLAMLPALRVLLVAKNRLTRLDGLTEVVHLEVLDLHGNQLQHLHGLSTLKRLRVLNAAGNLLREVSGLRGLDSLLELNLRRNLIRGVSDLHYLPRLQKLFLAHNEIFRYEDMSCVQGCLKLKELSLHHNPVSRHGLYFYTALTKFYRLKRLDEREIDLEMRKTAERMLQKAKEREKARSCRLHSAVSRASAICSARDNWNRLKVAHKRLRNISAATTSTVKQKEAAEETKKSEDEPVIEETAYPVKTVSDTEPEYESKLDSTNSNVNENKITTIRERLQPAELEENEQAVVEGTNNGEKGKTITDINKTIEEDSITQEICLKYSSSMTRPSDSEHTLSEKCSLSHTNLDEIVSENADKALPSGATDDEIVQETQLKHPTFCTTEQTSLDKHNHSSNTTDGQVLNSNSTTSPEKVTIMIVTNELQTNENVDKSDRLLKVESSGDINSSPENTLNTGSKNTVERYRSSPNLLVTQATLTENYLDQENQKEVETCASGNKNQALARSVSCWNLVLPLKNLTQKMQAAQAMEKPLHTNPTYSKLRLKKMSLPNKIPLRKSASTRSLVSLPEHRKMNLLTEGLENSEAGSNKFEDNRPKTANCSSNKKLRNDAPYQQLASSCDSLSSSDSSKHEEENENLSATSSSTAISNSCAKILKPGEKLTHPESGQNAGHSSFKIDFQQNKASSNGTNAAGSMLQPPPLTHRHSISNLNTSRNTSNSNATISTSGAPSTGLLRQQGKNYLAEIDSGMLNLYGQGALNCIDLQWDKTAASAATTAKFQYINFDEAIAVFSKLRSKFPKLQNFVFEETHLARFGQLNALAELHQVRSLSVGQDGNPITEHSQWQYYAIFRLTHWGLMVINGKPISDDERQEAMVQFGSLSQLAFMCLPRDNLNALMMASRNKTEGGSGGGEPSGEGGGSLGAPHLQELIGKEALQYRPDAAAATQEGSRAAGRRATRRLLLWSAESVARLAEFETVWPSVMHDMARDALADFSKPNYGKLMLDKIKAEMRINK